MGKNTCKLCSRRFANPRALAGHMRCHSTAAAAKPQISSASSASTSPLAGSGYVLRENPKKSFRLADPAFSGAGDSSVVVQDRESETESSPSRRSKKRPAGPLPEAEPASSVSDGATAEEDVALSLMMLSRDSWSRPLRPPPPPSWSTDSEGAEADVDRGRSPATGRRTRFQCGTCKKVFRSYQALGGHRASHKKGKGGCFPPPPPSPSPSPSEAPPLVANADKETKQPHECPYCSRMFVSGQALGGHKRSHVCSAAAAATAVVAPIQTSVAPKSFGLIDLNLPAPMDDDFELSAVSDLNLQAS